jgi:uncharacterized membrane protein YeaQ/YmgE (transglycosylase-associated protein family)
VNNRLIALISGFQVILQQKESAFLNAKRLSFLDCALSEWLECLAFFSRPHSTTPSQPLQFLPRTCRVQSPATSGAQEGSKMNFLIWIIVGLIAGWLAGQVMKGGGYGVLMDIILGLLGGLLGGWIFNMLGIWQGRGMIGSIIVAFIGAVILVWITRLIKRA